MTFLSVMMNKFHRIVFVLVMVLVGCSQFPGSTKPVLRIGLVAPFEGRNRDIGYDLIYSTRMAVRELNESGGIEGYRIELMAMDDGGDPELAVMAAQALAADPQVLCVMGHWLPETTQAAIPIYDQAGLLLLSTDQDSEDLSYTPPDFAAKYSKATPSGVGPGIYAYPAFNDFNNLVKVIRVAIRNYHNPTRQTVIMAYSK